MTACGAVARDQVQVLSTSVMGMCSKDHGGMILCMGRYAFSFVRESLALKRTRYCNPVEFISGHSKMFKFQ